MNRNNFINSDLEVLLKDVNNICVSIIGPTYRTSPDRRTNATALEKLVQEAKDQLNSKYPAAAVSPLIESIDELYEQIDFLHNTEGVGIFVSPSVKALIHFLFPVSAKVTVGDSFEIRDLIYNSYYDIHFRVLMLSQKEARLFNGRLNTLTEITDGHFPKQNTAAYEYNKPSRGSSYVGHSNVKEFEKDKGAMEAIRLKSFFREADKLLSNYLAPGTPLILMGDNKDLILFNEITAHKENIACHIPGNYTTNNETELGALAWKAMKLFLENGKEKLIRNFAELQGKGRGIAGIQNIWQAVMEGNCLQLLVEKDLVIPGFIVGDSNYFLHLTPPEEPHQVIHDSVGRLIQMVLEKNGEVIMLENDVLKDYNRLALITRY